MHVMGTEVTKGKSVKLCTLFRSIKSREREYQNSIAQNIP